MIVDGNLTSNVPDRGNYGVVVNCDNATGIWDYTNWQVSIRDFKKTQIKCKIDFESKMSDYLISLSNVSGEIIKQEHEATEQTGTDATIDYRYIGANPNNYVCLKDNNETCSEDELYRIIGVIPTQSSESGPYENRVKLIKNTKYGETYQWSDDESNADWATRKLNTEILNKEYWESIKDYQKYIENAKWYIGEVVTSHFNPTTFYKYERANNNQYWNYNTFFVANIGLFNGSDYFYATAGGTQITRNQCFNISAVNWGLESNKDCKNNSWLSDTLYFLTINPGAEKCVMSMYGNHGEVGNMGLTTQLHIKPTFYLKSNVKYLSGTGEQSNPYRVTIDANG